MSASKLYVIATDAFSSSLSEAGSVNTHVTSPTWGNGLLEVITFVPMYVSY